MSKFLIISIISTSFILTANANPPDEVRREVLRSFSKLMQQNARGDEKQVTLSETTGFEDLLQQKQKDFEECRQKYKTKIKEDSEKLEQLRKDAPMSVPDFHEKAQQQANSLASRCKAIKAEIGQIRNNKSVLEAFSAVPNGKKFGPVIRCYQIGQNWTEFNSCSKELSETANIHCTQSGGCWFRAGSVVAEQSKGYVRKLKISGVNFWGTTGFDKQFLQAFMSNYDIDRLEPVMEKKQYWFGNDSPYYTSYKYEGSGWKVKLYPTGEDDDKKPVVIFSFTSDSSSYKF